MKIQCHVLLYAGRWDTRGFRRSWGERIHDAIAEAIAEAGELLNVTCITAEPNDAGPVVTVEVTVDWWQDEPELVGTLYEWLVECLKPEYMSQIEVEIVDTQATLPDLDPQRDYTEDDWGDLLLDL